MSMLAVALWCLVGCRSVPPTNALRVTVTDGALLDLPPLAPVGAEIQVISVSEQRLHQLVIVPVPAPLGARFQRGGLDPRSLVEAVWRRSPIAVLTVEPGAEVSARHPRAVLSRPGWYLVVDPLPVSCRVRRGRPTCDVDAFGKGSGPARDLHLDRGVIGVVRVTTQVGDAGNPGP